ncbi:CopG family transcriptional regulator [Terrisporobacter mayombei]|uniref:ribbon-helix-helix domain-containing protein n=1 Tax=Terrisporobacter mayombei TaxID=1541 RepID=UPI001D1672FA|nr:CopG family transcriptional regulator [Terrisporobacter mayombei]
MRKLIDVKSERVTFRLSKKELNNFDNLAEARGVKRSEYLREMVLKEIENIPPVKITKEILQDCISDIFNKKGIQIMEIDFKNQNISTLNNGKVLIYRFELIENNTMIRFKNELGVIVFKDKLTHI